MTAITDIFKKQPLIMALLLFVVGFLLGWLGMGWGLWPVEYVNGDISQLNPVLQQQYVVLVADSYAATPDTPQALARIQELGPNAAQVISDTLAASKGAEAMNVSRLQLAVLPSLKQLAAPAKPSLLDQLRLPLLGCSLVVLLALVAGLVFWRVSSRRAPGAPRAPDRPPAPAHVEARPDETAPAGVPAATLPVARFMTTYTLGDDAYDDSFSVDGPDGNFLGECGMGISETIGVGDPKKVTAFEVWLFDKNDIRTVTRVVMSEHAFRDEALKSKLAAKGEPVMAQSGDTVSLETATLMVTARIVDMAYGGGALPPNSFFERLTIELAAYRKPEAAAAAAAPAAPAPAA
jgi:hypothetical protein